MEVYKISEMFVVLTCILGGAALGADFDLLRAVRRISGAHGAAAALLDLLFWLSAALIVYLCIYFSNDAKLRWFEFVGFAVGFAVHMRFFSAKCLFVLCTAVSFVAKIISTVARIFGIPISLCKNALKSAATAYFSAKSGVLYKLHNVFSKTSHKIRVFGENICRKF